MAGFYVVLPVYLLILGAIIWGMVAIIKYLIRYGIDYYFSQKDKRGQGWQ